MLIAEYFGSLHGWLQCDVLVGSLFFIFIFLSSTMVGVGGIEPLTSWLRVYDYTDWALLNGSLDLLKETMMLQVWNVVTKYSIVINVLFVTGVNILINYIVTIRLLISASDFPDPFSWEWVIKGSKFICSFPIEGCRFSTIVYNFYIDWWKISAMQPTIFHELIRTYA